MNAPLNSSRPVGTFEANFKLSEWVNKLAAYL